MPKTLIASLTTGILTMLLVTGCAEDSKDTVSTEPAETSTAPAKVSPAPAKVSPAQAAVKEETADTPALDDSIMDEPVNFSTPEDVSKTLTNIRQKAGARASRKLDSAMGYIMTYDLGVARDEERMYKKLNGKTPNQIISMMKG